MAYFDKHLADGELVKLADGELSLWQTWRFRRHLAACWNCRSRMNAIDAAISDFLELRRSEPPLPPAAVARQRLERRLAETAADLDAVRNRMHGGRIAVVAALSAIALLAGLLAGRRFVERYRIREIPASRLTPGETIATSAQDVCAEQPRPRIVPASLQREVFVEYGLAHASPAAFEVDYLITPELGGATSIRNLWPEPYSAKWNARVKDQLEDRLLGMVCRGEIDLATAQRAIAADWISSYKRYFHTTEPLRAPAE